MDNVTNTILLYKILEAFERDQKTQLKIGSIKKKLSKSRLQERINQYYAGKNENGVRLGYSKGRRLSQGESPDDVGSLTTDETLENLVKTLFVDMGNVMWEEVRKTIKEAGPEYSHLLSYTPRLVNQAIETFQQQPIGDIVPMKATVKQTLLAIAERHDEIARNADLAKDTIYKNEKQILMLTDEALRAREKIEIYKEALAELEGQLSRVSDPNELEKVKELIKKVKRELKP